MQSRRNIEVLLWDVGELLVIVLGIEDSIGKVSAAKAQMLAEQFSLVLLQPSLLVIVLADQMTVLWR